MNKQKLLGIILKDLDELKNLSEEIAEADSDAALVVDLALSKARLVAQEIELLREYVPLKSTRVEAIQPEGDPQSQGEDTMDTYSDPDLEILHFDGSSAENEPTEQLSDPAPIIEPAEEPVDLEEVAETEHEEEKAEESLALADEEPQEEIPAETETSLPEKTIEDKADDEDEEIVVYDEDEDREDELKEMNEPDEEPGNEHEIEINKLDAESQAEVREIRIDDLDDDEADSIKFSPAGKIQERPAFHEVPKPEIAPKDKQIIGEKFKKEPSLNDSMAEKRSFESKITNGPISSLRASIGLNDRFLFIREIFDNNAERYNLIIDKLDKLETIQQAVEYLKANLSLEKNDTSMKFVDLLKRRFTK